MHNNLCVSKQEPFHTKSVETCVISHTLKRNLSDYDDIVFITMTLKKQIYVYCALLRKLLRSKKNVFVINLAYAWYMSSNYLLPLKFHTNCKQEMKYFYSGLQDKVFDTTEGHNFHCDNRMTHNFLKYCGGLKLCHTHNAAICK